MASRPKAKQNGKFDFKYHRENGRGWRDRFFFSRDQQKILLHWILLKYPPLCSQRSFSSLYILFQKRLEEWLSSWKNYKWKWRGLRNKTMAEIGKQKESLYSLFWKGCRDCRWRWKHLGCEEHLKRENKKPQSWWLSKIVWISYRIKEGKKLGCRVDSLMKHPVLREKFNLEPAALPGIMRLPSTFPIVVLHIPVNGVEQGYAG